MDQSAGSSASAIAHDRLSRWSRRAASRHGSDRAGIGRPLVPQPELVACRVRGRAARACEVASPISVIASVNARAQRRPLNGGATLAVISDSAHGARIADLLVAVRRRTISARCRRRPLRDSPVRARRSMRCTTTTTRSATARSRPSAWSITPRAEAARRRPRDGRGARAPPVLASTLLEGSARRAAAFGRPPALRPPCRRHAGRRRCVVARFSGAG